jgi:hypothetical protein
LTFENQKLVCYLFSITIFFIFYFYYSVLHLKLNQKIIYLIKPTIHPSPSTTHHKPTGHRTHHSKTSTTHNKYNNKNPPQPTTTHIHPIATKTQPQDLVHHCEPIAGWIYTVLGTVKSIGPFVCVREREKERERERECFYVIYL